jgi:hypothetical protein
MRNDDLRKSSSFKCQFFYNSYKLSITIIDFLVRKKFNSNYLVLLFMRRLRGFMMMGWCIFYDGIKPIFGIGNIADSPHDAVRLEKAVAAFNSVPHSSLLLIQLTNC